MSNDKNDPQKGNRGGKKDDRSSQSNERRQPKDTRFKKGRSGNVRGRPPKKIEVREHDNPAIHHLMKHMQVRGAKGKVIQGRVLDLICMRWANMALNGNFKAFDKLIETAGGPQSIPFMTVTFFRSERLRGDEPDADEGDSGPDGPNPDEGGSGPNPLNGAPASHTTENNLDDSASDDIEEEDGTAFPTDGSRDFTDLNDKTIETKIKALRRRLSEHRRADKQQRDNDKRAASEQKRAESSKRKQEIRYFDDDGKLIDDSDAIQHSLADPTYYIKSWYRPHDCPVRLAGMRAEYQMAQEAKLKKEAIMTEPQAKASRAAPEIADREPISSLTAGEQHGEDSKHRLDSGDTLPTSNNEKGRVEV